jgi:acyl transferase domain-containing protein
MSDQTTNAGREDILKRALLEIKSMRAKVAEYERIRSEPIAITGIACRFPGGADTPERLWQILRDGIDTVVEVPRERWDINACWNPDPNTPGTMYTRSGAFLQEDLSAFDAEFFRISPREADSLDPQQRLLLEVAWEALEDAGEAPSGLYGTAAGVFIGISTNDYAQFTMYGDPEFIEAYTATGNALNAAAGRVAYFLGWQGPALAIDTACSSSLVAIHLACQSLRDEDCTIALAGGVNLILTPNGTIATSRARMMAPDGRCKTFDAKADGYGRGEGCGLVVLKRLSDAIAHRDRILAVIRGSAVNQNGASSALTVPNGQAQQNLIRKALNRAHVNPSSLSFFEAHGTGTSLGDPIEVESIQAVVSEGRDAGNVCALGSVKSNLGHLEAAAGVAGLMKVVLALGHGLIPPSLHLEQLNPRINLDLSRFAVPVTPQAWPRTDSPRLAAVSSFGFSGTNAHVILGESPLLEVGVDGGRPLHLLTLSAKSEEALGDLVSRYQTALADEREAGDVCFTANAGRSHFTHRLAVVGRSTEELREDLVSRFHSGIAGRPRVAFLFTGQGSQYAQMGRQLYESEPSFRRTIEECEEHLRDILPEPLGEVLYGSKVDLLNQTAYTQPALFAVEYGLAALWQSWGIEPVAVMGHSLGEYVAASVAGVFSMAEGIRLVGARGRLMQSLPAGGAMAAVLGAEGRVRQAVESSGGRLSVAAWNGPSNGVLSGDREEVERVEAELQAEGISVQRLRVSHAFHSARMEPVLEPFGEWLRKVQPSQPRIRWIANLTGEAMSQAPDAGYWLRQMREPVQFEASMRTLREQGCDVLVEAGPSPVLIGMGQRCWDGSGQEAAWLPSLRKGVDDWRQMLDSLAELYVHGCTVDWENFDQPWQRRRIALPTYPFQRKKFWVKTAATAPVRIVPRVQQTHSHPFLGRRIELPIEAALFESDFNIQSLPLVRDHRIHGMPWTNLVIYLEMVMASGAQLFKEVQIGLTDVSVPQGLILPERGSRRVQLVVQGNSFRIFSWNSSWTLHAQGAIELGAATDFQPSQLPAVPQGASEISAAEFYREMDRRGVSLGPSCQGLERMWTNGSEVLGVLKPADANANFELPMVWIDSAFQLLSALFPQEGPRDLIFTGLDSFQMMHAPHTAKAGWCRAVSTSSSDSNTRSGDISVFDSTGCLIAFVKNARLERAAIVGTGQPAIASRVADPVLDELRDTQPEDQRDVMTSYLVRTLAETLRMQPDQVDTGAPLISMLDSLMAVELKTRIEADLRIEVPIAAIFEGDSVRELGLRLLEGVQLAEECVDQMIRDLESLSDSEVEAMLRVERGERDD